MTIAEFRIEGLALHGRHGVLEAERSLGQHFFLDLHITADIGDAVKSDEIDDTLHYGQVIKAASATFNAKPYDLIEAAAGAVGDEMLRLFPKIISIRVTVHKPAAPVAALINDLSVSIERRR